MLRLLVVEQAGLFALVRAQALVLFAGEAAEARARRLRRQHREAPIDGQLRDLVAKRGERASRLVGEHVLLLKVAVRLLNRLFCRAR